MISKHQFDKKIAEEFFEDDIELIESRKEKARNNYKFLYRVYQNSIELVTIDNFINRLKHDNKIKHLRESLIYLAAFVKVKLHSGKAVDVDLGDEDKIVLKGDEKDNEIEDSHWLMLWNLSTILRDKSIMKWLGEIDTSKVILLNQKDHIKIFRDFFMVLYENIKTDKINHEIEESIFNIARRNFGQDFDTPPDIKKFPGPGMYLLFTQFMVFKFIELEDESQFNKWLQLSLQYHKEFWSQKRGLNKGDAPLYDDPKGFLSLPLTALCSMAFDKGMKIEVESDYIPKYLYEGTFLKK